jgi:acetylornithine deacetylase/succinyl-diaminopimelate desuccinylase family protein
MGDLLRAVAVREQAMVDLTSRLVAVPSENPPGNAYAECIQILTEALGEEGFAPELLEDACVRGSFGAGERCLYLHGHYDVVPAQRRDQFEPRVENGRLHGRGSADMKGGLAAMIHAVAALRDAGVELDGRVAFNLVPDEETGGERGSRRLADRGVLAPGAIGMLTTEPTGGVVWNANRGAVTMRVTVPGREAHVGLAHEGINAFERMLDVASALRELGREVTARGSILLLGGTASSGANFNVVPASASFTVDRRPNPDEDLATERARIVEVLERFRRDGVELDVEIFQEGDSAGTSEDDPLARALAASVAEVEGSPPAFELCPGLLETRWYARDGIPALAYGPGRLDISHGPEEHVEIDALVRCATVYALTIARVLGRASRASS